MTNFQECWGSNHGIIPLAGLDDHVNVSKFIGKCYCLDTMDVMLGAAADDQSKTPDQPWVAVKYASFTYVID